MGSLYTTANEFANSQTRSTSMPLRQLGHLAHPVCRRESANDVERAHRRAECYSTDVTFGFQSWLLESEFFELGFDLKSVVLPSQLGENEGDDLDE